MEQQEIFSRENYNKHLLFKKHMIPLSIIYGYSSIINNIYGTWIKYSILIDILDKKMTYDNENIIKNKLYSVLPNVQFVLKDKIINIKKNNITNKQIFRNLFQIFQQVWLVINILNSYNIGLQNITIDNNVRFVNLEHDIILLYKYDNIYYEIKTNVFVYLINLDFINSNENVVNKLYGQFVTSFLNFCDPSYEDIDLSKLNKNQLIELISKYGAGIHAPYHGGKKCTEFFIDYCKLTENINIKYNEIIYLNMIYNKLIKNHDKLRRSWEKINNISYTTEINDKIPSSKYLLSIDKNITDYNNFFDCYKYDNGENDYYEIYGNNEKNIINYTSVLHKIINDNDNNIFNNLTINKLLNEENQYILIDKDGIDKIIGKIDVHKQFDDNILYYIFSTDKYIDVTKNNIYHPYSEKSLGRKINANKNMYNDEEIIQKKIMELVYKIEETRNGRYICHNIVKKNI